MRVFPESRESIYMPDNSKKNIDIARKGPLYKGTFGWYVRIRYLGKLWPVYINSISDSSHPREKNLFT